MVPSRVEARSTLRLLCLPCAGLGASMYRAWPSTLSADADAWLIQPPGRESRWKEAPFRNLHALVEAAGRSIGPLIDAPFAIFGHSMGALVGFELARWLEAEYGLIPRHLFVSAHRAPHVPDRRPPLHGLSDGEFVAAVRDRYNAIPQAVIDAADLLELVLPCVRADFELVERYVWTSGAPLGCPITAFGGRGDANVTTADLEAWGRHTTGRFAFRMFEGGHFFVQSARDEVLAAVAGELHAGADERVGC